MRAKPSLLGKDEVASSNLASSSKRKPIRLGWAFFWIYGVRELATSSAELPKATCSGRIRSGWALPVSGTNREVAPGNRDYFIFSSFFAAFPSV